MGGNSVHIGGTLLGKSLTGDELFTLFTFDDHFSDILSSLEFDEAVSDVLTSEESAVLGADTVSLLTRVVLSEGVDTNLTSHVELISDGGSSDVEPVLVIRRQILVAENWREKNKDKQAHLIEQGLSNRVVFLDDTYLWNVDLVTLLEMLGEGLNEFLSWNILDCDTFLFVEDFSVKLFTKKKCYTRRCVISYLLPSLFRLSSCLIDNNQ